MKYIIRTLFVFALTISLGTPPSACSESGSILSVEEFRATELVGSRSYRVKGFVVHRYECPPCPRGALCKPCMGDNIILSDKKGRIENYSQRDKSSIIIYTRGDLQLSFDDAVIANIKTGRVPEGESALDYLQLISLEVVP